MTTTPAALPNLTTPTGIVHASRMGRNPYSGEVAPSLACNPRSDARYMIATSSPVTCKRCIARQAAPAPTRHYADSCSPECVIGGACPNHPRNSPRERAGVVGAPTSAPVALAVTIDAIIGAQRNLPDTLASFEAALAAGVPVADLLAAQAIRLGDA